MNNELNNVHENMLELGLSALAHANYHSAYYNIDNDKWDMLSVIQAAHAAEILFKARIAKEHPLLIFESLPKISTQQLSIKQLTENGRTITWSDIPKVLWASSGIKIPNIDCFIRFGKLRNSIQHFGLHSGSMNTLEFIFSVIDPFINECWGLYAVDFDEDHDSSEYLPATLLRNEILFLPSPSIISSKPYWDIDWNSLEINYKNEMLDRFQKIENGTK